MPITALVETTTESPRFGTTAAVPMVARRPVLDRRLRTVGYRLTTSATDPAASLPTAADLDQLTDGRPAFVAVTPDSLRRVWPADLDPSRVVLELTLQQLLQAGMSLDHLRDREVAVSLHIPSLRAQGLADGFGALRRPGVRILAADVETADQFEVLRQSGFDLFLGAFYARPGRGRTSTLPAGSTTALSTLAKLQEHGADLERLAEIVQQDVGLCYRLLGYANSAAVGMRRNVGTVREALVLLGTRTVRQWATALVLAGLDDRPHALMSTAAVRARACEQLAAHHTPELAERAFTVGLLSLLDAIVDAPMHKVLAELPLADDIVLAIMDRTGPTGHVLQKVVAYERGDFDAPVLQGATGDLVTSAYRDAVRWADSFV